MNPYMASCRDKPIIKLLDPYLNDVRNSLLGVDKNKQKNVSIFVMQVLITETSLFVLKNS